MYYPRNRARKAIVLVDWREFLPLKDGEYIVTYWAFTHGGVARTSTLAKGGDGLFVLTNQRLTFLETEKEGFLGAHIKSFRLREEIPLESIQDISRVKDEDRFKIIVHAKEKKYTLPEKPVGIFFSDGQPKDKHVVEHFREIVLQQMKERRQELERKRMPAVIDFSFLKTFIENGGIVLTTLKCPHCSAPIKMPKTGTEIVCDHCGSTILAQDIFEKVKTLIG